MGYRRILRASQYQYVLSININGKLQQLKAGRTASGRGLSGVKVCLIPGKVLSERDWAMEWGSES